MAGSAGAGRDYPASYAQMRAWFDEDWKCLDYLDHAGPLRCVMRLLPSGSTSLLVELDDLDEVLALYTALLEQRPAGVVDVVPAGRTVLLVTDPSVTSLPDVEAAVRTTTPRRDRRQAGELVEVPVTYDGDDLDEVGTLLGCDAAEVVRRHTSQEWTVAFCGFAPGFGYMTSDAGGWDVPRRSSPRTRVPTGSVALAGEFSGIYPRESPGGWQLVGRTEVAVTGARSCALARHCGSQPSSFAPGRLAHCGTGRPSLSGGVRGGQHKDVRAPSDFGPCRPLGAQTSR